MMMTGIYIYILYIYYIYIIYIHIYIRYVLQVGYP